jgi:hypothetical protein
MPTTRLRVPATPWAVSAAMTARRDAIFMLKELDT